MENNNVNKILAAIAEDKNIPWQITSVVKVPGAMEIYACGTTGDVTILACVFTDGHVSLKVTCW